MNESKGRSMGSGFLIGFFNFVDAGKYIFFTIPHLVMMITMSAIAML